MIVVFPILTDESVSQNVLPGICKALEKFILIYEMDALMAATGLKILKIGGQIAAAAASTMLAGKMKNESIDFIGEAKPVPTPPTKGDINDPEKFLRQFGDEVEAWARDDERKNFKDSAKEKRERLKQPFDTLKNIRDAGTVVVNMPQDQVISVEPTYVTVTTTAGTRIIGVKVIPFPVKTNKNYSLAELLTADASLDFMDTMTLKIQRKAIRAFWALCRGLRIPFLKDRVITGDPEKDIIWASTFHKRSVFCLLNYSDISNSDFFKNAGGIHKLHSIGWNSFILADDVNKRAIFCMKEFHGLCSSTPYSFIYTSIGKEHGKIYTSLEDIKKTASPFFKLSVNSKKVFGEAKSFIQSYLNRIQ